MGRGAMVLLLCQGMPLTEIEGYCFYAHELFWTWGLIGEGPLNIQASLLFKLLQTGLDHHFLESKSVLLVI